MTLHLSWNAHQQTIISVPRDSQHFTIIGVEERLTNYVFLQELMTY